MQTQIVRHRFIICYGSTIIKYLNKIYETEEFPVD